MQQSSVAHDIARSAAAEADAIGVELIVEWQQDQQRLTFAVTRLSGPPGTGADAIRHLLHLADGAGVEVAIDVLESSPDLLRYYRRFGFRAFSEAIDPTVVETEEEAGIEELTTMRNAFLAIAGNTAADFGVTFMWRDTPPRET